MNVNTLKLSRQEVSRLLGSLEPRPANLFWRGASPDMILARPKVAFVGSRKATAYGRTITDRLAGEIASAGAVIVSGLAFGIDSFSHRAALEAGGLTVAVLPTPLDKITPAANLWLASRIIKGGGALVSEYPAGAEIHKVNFIARNRIVAALADVLVITEAARNSGSLHTARFALEQGKTVMALPGNITSPASEGCNNLIKSGAVPVTAADDIFFALGIKPAKEKTISRIAGSGRQQKLFELIAGGTAGQEELVAASSLPAAEVSSALTDLELRGLIRPAGGGQWIIR
ncbi:MAG TPA: DNA-processing protein DprA [Candidatus Saccharimonadales bacterium]|nr:DNA-processing protein DprA [Candidatus Saccharimonadales bacterium]